MPRKVLNVKPITVPEAKAVLESLGEENLGQFQRRTLDYTIKFSKVDPEKAEKIVNTLIERFGMEREEAVQIVNCMPKSIEELRIFLAAGRRIIETSRLEDILKVLNEYRNEEG
ncbi:RNA polymerase Rpb4 [Candidatus Bathyarchaeota archaeon]|nr:MAG: RNA polymerase Rpb4 [Candidatus Bathyarchaeota archaeon]